MSIRFFRIYNKIISRLLGLLGFSLACSGGCVMYGTVAEYGAPHADFKITGKVTTIENIAIPGIQIVLLYDTTFSDVNGNYFVGITDFPSNQNYPIHFSDVDGSSNGNYQDLDTNVVFSNPQFTGGDGNWYSGETQKEFNVKLKNQ